MSRQARFRFIPLLLTACLFGAAQAEEVTLPHQGLTLNADLVQAKDKSLADGVFLITHGTLAHGRMEIVRTLQHLLREQGYNSLAITLSLGIDRRHGMYDCAQPHRHKNSDAVDEIGAWLGWLEQQGAGDVVLLGHSRGGNQTAWYAAEHPVAPIKAVVLIAPASRAPGVEPAHYQKRFKKDLAPTLKQARTLVAEGKGAVLMEHVDFVYCPDTSATAEAFLSYHDEEPRMYTPDLLSAIKVPVLVFGGSEDTVVDDLEQTLAEVADGDKVQLKMIDGADHFFRDLYAEEVVEGIVEFVEGL